MADPQTLLWERILDDFSPCILHGEEGSQHARKRDYEPQDGYCLWHFTSGGVVLEEDGTRRHLAVPGIYLTVPRQAGIVRIPPNTTFRRIHFALRAGPRHLSRKGKQTRTVVVEDGPQPSAMDWLGVDLPFEVPKALVEHTARRIARWCHLWYQDAQRRLRANLELGLWLCDLIDHLFEEPSVGATWEEDLAIRIRRHLGGGLTCSQLAKLVGLSASQLNRRCRDVFGCSALDRINDVRQEVAERELRRADVDMLGVARACGFKSSAAFSRWFVARNGRTPSEWRRDPEGHG